MFGLGLVGCESEVGVFKAGRETAAGGVVEVVVDEDVVACCGPVVEPGLGCLDEDSEAGSGVCWGLDEGALDFPRVRVEEPALVRE